MFKTIMAVALLLKVMVQDPEDVRILNRHTHNDQREEYTALSVLSQINQPQCAYPFDTLFNVQNQCLLFDGGE